MKNVIVHYDYASPWAFIATETIERKLPGVPLTWVPTYLRGLESFATGIPDPGQVCQFWSVAAGLVMQGCGELPAELEERG